VSWGADGSIVFSEGSTGIWRVAAEGGEPERIVEIPASQTAHGPQLLPDGRRVLFTLAPADDWDRAQIVTQVLGTGERTVLISTGRDGRYLPGGYLLYVEGTTLFAARFDPTTLSVGTTVPVVEDVGRVVNRLSMAAQFSVSASGTLVYAAAIEGRTSSLVWFSRSGRSEPLKAMPPRAYYGARLSPDGGRIAMEIQDENREIWTWDVAAEKLERKTFDPAWDGAPLWSHDGRHLFFTSDRAGGPFRLFWQMADGTGKAEPLSTDPAADPTAVSPDGERLIFQEFVRSNADIMELSLSGVRARRPLIRTAATERNATVSPDGRWLAYESNSSGRPEIYVKPYPNVESGIWQVSLGGGQQPRWSRKGDELFYINPAAGSSTAFMSVKVTGVNTWAHDSPVKLFDTDYPFPIGSTGRTEYDVAPDQRFLLLKPVPSSDVAPQALSIVVNWTEDLRRLVPQR
jgi:serine/threonine-protein kinase